MNVYIHDFAEAVCDRWQGFCSVEETISMVMQLGFLPKSPFFGDFSNFDYSLWSLERPSNE